MAIYDSLIRYAKPVWMAKEYIEMVREARIFEVGLETYNGEDKMDLVDVNPVTLSLPFPITAVVSPQMAFIFKAPTGVSRSGKYIFFTDIGESADSAIMVVTGQYTMTYPDITMNIQGLISGNRHNPNVVMSPSSGITFEPRAVKQREEYVAETARLTRTMLINTFHAIACINTLDRFILEVAPAKLKATKKIPREHQRPKYIILTPKEIRKYLNTSHEVTGRVQSGHDRRGHTRTYPDDPARYPNAHGKTVWIDAMWVGTTEKVVGNKKYKVILDERGM